MAEERREPQSISKQALQRMPLYLNYLKTQKADKENISAPMIAAGLGLNEVQVRKGFGGGELPGGQAQKGF